MGFFASSRGGSALPRTLTSFHGRKLELGQLRRLLGAHRLVTLTGTAGIGKTRLAVEVARPAGAQGLVAIEELADPRLLPGAIAEAAGLPDPSRAWTLDELAAAFGSRDVLLVLDGCEVMVDACAELAEALLMAAPGLRLLATSREPLAVPGEVTWGLQPLSQEDAVALFVERCTLSRPDLELDHAGTRRAARIVEALGGIPLALELAAVRLRSMSLDDLEDRLDDWLRLATGGARTRDKRRQTLRSAAEWTHGLLAEHERVLFERLSVFRGSFSLAAAEAVCALPPLHSADVLGLLGGLVDRSLVVLEPGGYRVPRAVRAYAGEALEASHDVDALRQRHALAYLERLEAGWEQPLQLERDNLRSALEWTHGRDAATHARLCAALAPHWLAAGDLQEGADRVGSALQLGAGSAAVEARLRVAAGALALARGELAAARSAVGAAGEYGASLRVLVEASTPAEALPELETTIPAWAPAAQGALALAATDLEGAEAAFGAGLERGGLAAALALEGLAEVAARRRDHERALRLAGAAAAARRSTSAARPHWWQAPDPPPVRASYAALGQSAARAALRRGEAMTPAELEAYWQGESRPGDPSARELEIAALVAEGLTNRQIAARIHLSVRTVEGHVERLRGKLGFTTRARIAAWVAEKQVARG